MFYMIRFLTVFSIFLSFLILFSSIVAIPATNAVKLGIYPSERTQSVVHHPSPFLKCGYNLDCLKPVENYLEKLMNPHQNGVYISLDNDQKSGFLLGIADDCGMQRYYRGYIPDESCMEGELNSRVHNYDKILMRSDFNYNWFHDKIVPHLSTLGDWMLFYENIQKYPFPASLADADNYVDYLKKFKEFEDKVLVPLGIPGLPDLDTHEGVTTFLMNFPKETQNEYYCGKAAIFYDTGTGTCKTIHCPDDVPIKYNTYETGMCENDSGIKKTCYICR